MEEVMEKNSQYPPDILKENLSEKIPLRMKFGYGIGDFACNIVFQTITLYLVYFLYSNR